MFSLGKLQSGEPGLSTYILSQGFGPGQHWGAADGVFLEQKHHPNSCCVGIGVHNSRAVAGSILMIARAGIPASAAGLRLCTVPQNQFEQPCTVRTVSQPVECEPEETDPVAMPARSLPTGSSASGTSQSPNEADARVEGAKHPLYGRNSGLVKMRSKKDKKGR